MRLIIAISAIAAISGASALAGEKSEAKCKGMDKHMMQVKAEDHFKAVDADADGKVSEAELLAFVTAKAKTEFASMAGDDAVVTLDEMKAHHHAKHEAMMKEQGEKAEDEHAGHH